MSELNLACHRIADTPDWQGLNPPPIKALGFEYVFAGNGIFVRAEDTRMEAMVLQTPASVGGLVHLEPYARLKGHDIPASWLWSILSSMRRHLPNECVFQMILQRNQWRAIMPEQSALPTSVHFDDNPLSVVDIHSHAVMDPFWSSTDDADELGLRFYVVIGNLDQAMPTARARVGIYGLHMDVPLASIFDDFGLGYPVRDLYESEDIDAESAR
jgi:PRTRC genetic system protein A